MVKCCSAANKTTEANLLNSLSQKDRDNFFQRSLVCAIAQLGEGGAVAKEAYISRFYQLVSTIHKSLNEPRNAQLMQQKYEKRAARKR